MSRRRAARRCWRRRLPLSCCSAVAAARGHLDEIKKRGYLIVATEDDFRPFEFVKDGKPTGFDNELVDELRKYAPFEIKQEILPWTGLLAGVSTGKYDVAITAAIITKERTQVARLHQPDRRRDALLRQAQGRHDASSRSRI